MAWFDSRTLFLSVSLFCLPALVVCAVLCLPLVIFFIVTLYFIAWTMYLLYAQRDVEFNLPYNPARVLKVNVIVFSHVLSWITDTPMIISYLYWRYWQIGTDKFRRIVSRNVVYSNASNQCLMDIYHPDIKNNNRKRPVIIFIYGGSWASGQKLLYTSMANTLRELGYVVIVPDYRKYPTVKNVDTMYEDVRQAIKWTFHHANDIGADEDMIYVMGHSAGAHLASQVVLFDLVEKAKHASLSAKKKLDGDSIVDISRRKDFLPQIEGLLLFAGVYDIESHYEHETMRGVEKISAMGRVMGSTVDNFRKQSPFHLVKSHSDLFADSEDLLDFAPRILFVHGEKDLTVPMEQSTTMYNMLGEVLPPAKRDEVDVRVRLYKKMDHAHCVTALMPSIFGVDRMQKPLIRDIVEFLDVPPLDGH
ncbi:Alpha/Beta hydrolase protein [Halteromyces radiatus]|uniref:Alpha/Beta hydrolase protein n=1 Tax=Halteromyces radiatus TaxID=101107 RepID=UPI0022211240|nr:Alpha/Beta hydrolase protein [Halteromyces radiatus]KAI8096874.1 Alpha/Beta hydrolase protein [Halteromyces radiatus]